MLTSCFLLQHTVWLPLNQWGNRCQLLSWFGLRMISARDMLAGKLLLLHQAASTESLGTCVLLAVWGYLKYMALLCSFCVNVYCCRSKLKEHMQYCVDHPEEINKLAKVQAQVSEVKNVMMENIEKVHLCTLQIHRRYNLEKVSDPYSTSEIQVLDRGEKIELLVDKTENLRSQVLIIDTFFYPALFWALYFNWLWFRAVIIYY